MLTRIYYVFAEFLLGLSEVCEWILQLRWSVRLMDGSTGFFHGVTDTFEWFIQTLDDSLYRPWWQTILMLPVLIPYWIGSTIYSILAHPYSIAILDPDRARNFCWGIPSILAMLLTLFASFQAVTASKTIDDRYRISMKQALGAGNPKLATILGGRLVSDRADVDPDTRFSYAIALRRSGEVGRSDAVLTSLAPTDQPGYAPAHRLRALSLAEQLKNGSNETVLEQLRWHLENSGDEPSATIENLWTSYFVTIGQPEEALKHLAIAAKIDPRFLIALANLYTQTNNTSGELRTLKAAEAEFQSQIDDDPLAHECYVQLAIAQNRLRKPALAEKTILKGVKLLNDARMRRFAADFYISQYDTALKEKPTQIRLQFDLLTKALGQDLFYSAIYERLISFYSMAQLSEEANETENLLKTLLSEGRSPALAHFALSGIYELQGNESKAQFHIFQSYRLDSNFPLVTNNLAWILANSEQPDLPKAYELVQNAIVADPGDQRFLDTRATILMKQGKTHDAIAEFEAILAVASDKVSIHRRLVELYGKLDILDMAKMHSEKAKDIAKAIAEKTK